MRVDHLEDVGGGRRAGEQDRRRAHAERKVQCVAEAIREEQLRDAVAAVVLSDAQHAACIQLGAHHHVVMQVDAAFARAGAARRVQPESRVVLAGGLGLELGRRDGEKLVERVRASRGGADDQHLAQIAQPLGRDGLQLRDQRFADHRHSRARVVEDVLVVGWF